jgi:hypothetical protein
LSKLGKIIMSSIGLWIDNLMDRVRVGDQLNKNGIQIVYINSLESCTAFLQTNQGMVIIDLQSNSLDLENMQKQLASQPELIKRMLVYFPHVQIHLKKAAEECGIEHVYPRSVFFSDSWGLIQRIRQGES